MKSQQEKQGKQEKQEKLEKLEKLEKQEKQEKQVDFYYPDEASDIDEEDDSDMEGKEGLIEKGLILDNIVSVY